MKVRKDKLILLAIIIAACIPIAIADEIIYNPFLGGPFNSTAFTTVAGSACTATDNGGNDKFYTCTGGSNQNRANFDKMVNTTNFSIYMTMNISIDSSGNHGRVGAFSNQDSALGGGLGEAFIQSGAAYCVAGTAQICLKESDGGSEAAATYIKTNDAAYYPINITFNGTQFNIYNIPYQAGQVYHLNTTYNLGTLGAQDYRVPIDSITFGIAADGGTITYKFQKLIVMNVTGPAAAAPDVTAPIINGTINNTSPQQNMFINASYNITDETALSAGNISHNMSGVRVVVNFTISGTSAQISNVTQVTCAAGCVINFTGFARDSSGNTKQNSTLITVSTAAGAVAKSKKPLNILRRGSTIGGIVIISPLT